MRVLAADGSEDRQPVLGLASELHVRAPQPAQETASLSDVPVGLLGASTAA